MIDADFVTKIKLLAQKAQEIEVETVNGIEYSSRSMHRVEKPPPAIETIQLSTLNGIVDYCVDNKDGFDLGTYVIHVKNPNEVYLLSKLDDQWKSRNTVLSATCGNAMSGFVGKYHTQEWFTVALQALFTDAGARDKILEVVGNIQEESVRTTGDDGTTQTVTARAGIARVNNATVPNPVTLAPYRTFSEVEQPVSEFVLRLKSGTDGELPHCALFEADGGRWELQAIERIAKFLAEHLDVTIIA